mmetsp:Transcript_162/g.613  ORF Transcript_162/g.613 Transcript_162/m.613 type:complete len:236 (-) Transcript_162:6-713(-)
MMYVPSFLRAASSSDGTSSPRSRHRRTSSSASARISSLPETFSRTSSAIGGRSAVVFGAAVCLGDLAAGGAAAASPASAAGSSAGSSVEALRLRSFLGGAGGQSTSSSWKSETYWRSVAWSSAVRSSKPARSSTLLSWYSFLRMRFIIWKNGTALCQLVIKNSSSSRGTLVILPMRSSPFAIVSLDSLQVERPDLAYSTAYVGADIVASTEASERQMSGLLLLSRQEPGPPPSSP